MDMQKALKQQQNEIDEYHIYMALSRLEKGKNSEILAQIAKDELRHYQFWLRVTKQELKPRMWRVRFYVTLAKLFGLSFALKKMEMGEEGAEQFYLEVAKEYPEAKKIYEDEARHETMLINMLQDEKLMYAGAVVLGMNDALVELTGTLTGVALAFSNAKYVGITGVIMGIAASLSMAGSAYLEARENADKGIEPKKYSLYTGLSYILTTIIVVLPFFIFNRAKVALIFMFMGAALSILVYNYYIAVAREEDFAKRVKEMFLITFGVAAISFVIGFLVNRYFGIEI
ncbi:MULTISPECIES: VIT1/CCC1 transporter family protein [unclassified Nitratiruptor]|uniref:VIT1/CCC1 transporter family protein n=1 Tax=unclassified Nitratiruptor TaxID=2624044 RepID=UPI0019159E12|nr:MULTISPECIES: VIT1/CCC1 transporter family protein [unclassified Nitratiruptor]BCD59390.1 hypothetical protein NitYY0810_C0121 [Nitratiruptor sp. YY08-10]BCD63314.1 hypothetical protein NitYY0814_C0121 [Nitratiruptor sp. YY08-14]